MPSSNNKLVVDLFSSSHPIWRTLLEKPPDDVKYIERRGYAGKAYLLLSGLARVKNLIHFCNGAKLAYGRRWVADMESVMVFFKNYESMYDSDAVAAAQKRLETGECKYILPLTNAARKTLERFLKIDWPIEVVYPTFYSRSKISYDRYRNVVVFVGGSWRNMSFEAKGGREVAEAWFRIYRSFPSFRMVMLSSPPPQLGKKLQEAGVKVGYMPRDRILSEVYPRARVIILPSMMDTVGYSVIEAMNYGVVPIVSDHFAMPELVGDAGIVVKAPAKLWNDNGTPNLGFMDQIKTGPFEEFIEKIVDALTRLLDVEDYWRGYSEKALLRMHSPPFNIDYRNRILRKIYESAVES
uniref:Glycosyltransferase n=1 Tax=Caldiarchaeum subterraneum TaxID=311458 RepID=E6NA47_CALS0|nr:hypothetical protein HGMM_F51A06C46 [Candidatus Caldarchaeum subterraneum]